MAAAERSAPTGGRAGDSGLAHSAGALAVDVHGGRADFASAAPTSSSTAAPARPPFIHVAHRHPRPGPSPPFSGWLGHEAGPSPFGPRLPFRAGGVERCASARRPCWCSGPCPGLDAALDVFDGIEDNVDRRPAPAPPPNAFRLGVPPPGGLPLTLASPVRPDPCAAPAVVPTSPKGYAPCRRSSPPAWWAMFPRPRTIHALGASPPLYIGAARFDAAIDALDAVLTGRLWDDPAYAPAPPLPDPSRPGQSPDRRAIASKLLTPRPLIDRVRRGESARPRRSAAIAEGRLQQIGDSDRSEHQQRRHGAWTFAEEIFGAGSQPFVSASIAGDAIQYGHSTPDGFSPPPRCRPARQRRHPEHRQTFPGFHSTATAARYTNTAGIIPLPNTVGGITATPTFNAAAGVPTFRRRDLRGHPFILRRRLITILFVFAAVRGIPRIGIRRSYSFVMITGVTHPDHAGTEQPVAIDTVNAERQNANLLRETTRPQPTPSTRSGAGSPGTTGPLEGAGQRSGQE